MTLICKYFFLIEICLHDKQTRCHEDDDFEIFSFRSPSRSAHITLPSFMSHQFISRFARFFDFLY